MKRFALLAGLVLSLMAGSAASGAEAMDGAGNAPLFTPVTQTIDPCHKQCAPLLNLDSRSEAQRTYHNCRALCDRKGEVICPDGSRKSSRTPRC